jgi:lysozyme family protein
MADAFQACLDIVLQEEGGFWDDPNGGPTNLGVTLGALQTYYGQSRVATLQDIRDLTPATVAPIYMIFWGGVHARFLPAGLDLAVFDFAVNAGVRHAATALQSLLNVPVDGLIGPVTINAALAADVVVILNKYRALRAAYYRGLEGFDTFGAGWLARVDHNTAAALKMASPPLS